MSEKENKALMFAKERCIRCENKENCTLPCSDAIHMLFFDCGMSDFLKMEELMKDARQKI